MIQDYLKAIPLFSNLNNTQLRLIRSSCREVAMLKDEAILRQDEEGMDLYIILAGKVKVTLMGEKGNEIVLDTLSTGDFFGELSILDRHPRSANVIAVSDVRLLTLARDAFFRIVREDSSATILNNIFSIMAARLRKEDETIGSLVFLDVCGRVARILIELARREGRKGTDGFIKMESPTHQTIASQIGASREAVTKAIKSLASNGLITIEGREVIISQRQFELL